MWWPMLFPQESILKGSMFVMGFLKCSRCSFDRVVFEWVYCCYRVLTCSSWCSFDNIVNILKGSNVAVGFFKMCLLY